MSADQVDPFAKDKFDFNALSATYGKVFTKQFSSFDKFKTMRFESVKIGILKLEKVLDAEESELLFDMHARYETLRGKITLEIVKIPFCLCNIFRFVCLLFCCSGRIIISSPFVYNNCIVFAAFCMLTRSSISLSYISSAAPGM